jgi:hypothetical protein
LMNFTEQEQRVEVGDGFSQTIGKLPENGFVVLQPYDISILVQERASQVV